MTRAMVVTRWVGNGTPAAPNRPAVADAYPIAGWWDRTAQPAEWIPKGALPYTVEIEASDAVLNLIEADSGYALLWRGERPVALDAATLATQIASTLHADLAAYVTAAESYEEAEQRLIDAQLHKPWEAGEAVTVDDVRAYEANLYRCVQAHTTQGDWTPTATPALWARFYDPSAGIPPWVQPTGAHDAYNTGDRVTFEGSVYESLIDGNVWSPTAYPAGWQLIE